MIITCTKDDIFFAYNNCKLAYMYIFSLSELLFNIGATQKIIQIVLLIIL